MYRPKRPLPPSPSLPNRSNGWFWVGALQQRSKSKFHWYLSFIICFCLLQTTEDPRKAFRYLIWRLPALENIYTSKTNLFTNNTSNASKYTNRQQLCLPLFELLEQNIDSLATGDSKDDEITVLPKVDLSFHGYQIMALGRTHSSF